MFDHLKKDDNVKADGDVIYSGLFPTNVYPFTIETAWVGETDSEAAFMDLSLISDDGRTLSQRVFFQSGKEKGHSITYFVKDKQGKPTDEKRYLPGFTIANDIHEHITGKELAEMVTENAIVNCWDAVAKRELPQEKPTLPQLHGKRIKLGIQEQLVCKQKKNSEGKYEDTSESRKQNEAVKVFNADNNKTSDEVTSGKDATFMEKWTAQYRDQVFDKRTKAQKKLAEDAGESSDSSGGDEGSGKKTFFS
jgi:hypothetical protein